jgi:hypothetical protein
MTTTDDGRLSQPFDNHIVDLVDPVDQCLEQEYKQKELEQPGRSLPLLEVEPASSNTLINGQQSQQVNIPDESLSQPSTECVDPQSTSGSTISEESTISLTPSAIAPLPAQVDGSLKVGDRVEWDECPAHCSCFNPFTIYKIEESKAWLEYYSEPVPLAQLRRSL